jgi:hypothetical protein
MPVPIQDKATQSVRTIISPYPRLPVYIAPTATVPQPTLGPDVAPIPLFTTPKVKNQPIHKLFFPALAVIALYFYW